jgi:uncharacterized Zn-finger protein
MIKRILIGILVLMLAVPAFSGGNENDPFSDAPPPSPLPLTEEEIKLIVEAFENPDTLDLDFFKLTDIPEDVAKYIADDKAVLENPSTESQGKRKSSAPQSSPTPAKKTRTKNSKKTQNHCPYPNCNSSFTTQWGFVQHMKDIHDDLEPFKCLICSRGFGWKLSLTEHMKTHTGEEKTNCPVPGCSATFWTKKGLKQHQQCVHSERVFECPDCGSTFKSRRYLEQHQQCVHSERVFECPDCGSAFKSRGDLKRHQQRVHSDNRPFPCPHPDCGWASKSRRYLKRHLQYVHSDNRPFPCPYPDCGSAFKSKEDLKRHLGTHSRGSCESLPEIRL